MYLHSGAPQIIITTITFVIQGDMLTINCCVMSYPQSNVSLLFGGNPLVTSVSEVFNNGLFSYYVTYTTMAMYPSDESNYTCSATITHGQPAVTEVHNETVFVPVYGGSCSHVH